jgi:5-methylthioadenosine/S-adenosylhomocysteine deaminase
MQKTFEKIRQEIVASPDKKREKENGRYSISKKNYERVLIQNIPLFFTCDENEKLRYFENRSIIIEGDTIREILPAEKVKTKDFDLIYDAGKKGGVMITPGMINTHAHIHMYLLRSAMLLDEKQTVDETIAAMAVWQKYETENSYAYASLGDITEQQKNGITTTLTHGPSFLASEVAARISRQNILSAVSAVSNSRPENNPKMVENLLERKKEFICTPAVSLHYLWKTPSETLREVKRITEKHQALLTFHMAESEAVVEETLKKHAMSETEVLEKFGLLNENSIASHAIHLKQKEIEKMARAKVGIAHLPTSNTIHKSGTFPFWNFNESGGYPFISLGTDSVVSKNRLDSLSEAYQARITHLYSRTIKFGSLFKMTTVNGARVLGMPDRGRILPGMKADLVFWKLRDRSLIPFDKKNPFSLLGNLITHSGKTVRDLMVNGKFVIKNRKHQLIDESKLLEILQEKHMEMKRKVERNQ